MSRGRVHPVLRTTDGLVQIDSQTLGTFHGAQMTAAAAAVAEIRDGGATGDLLFTLRLAAAGEDETPFFSERGIATKGGIWVEVVSGTPTVTVYAS